jgi:hypothetical protein
MIVIIEERNIPVGLQPLTTLLTRIGIDEHDNEYPQQQEQLDGFCYFRTTDPIKKFTDQNIDSSDVTR